jgi:uncharacterized protein YijF (DUF1287 family)
VLKSEAWRVQHPETMQNLHARIALLETFISEHTDAMKQIKMNVKNYQEQVAFWKKKNGRLQNGMRQARGINCD